MCTLMRSVRIASKRFQNLPAPVSVSGNGLVLLYCVNTFHFAGSAPSSFTFGSLTIFSYHRQCRCRHVFLSFGLIPQSLLPKRITGSESINIGIALIHGADCLCKWVQSFLKAMRKDVLPLAASLGFYHIYFGGFNRHVMGPESCLDLHFILQLARWHRFPHGDLPSPFPGVILFISSDHLSGGITQQPIHYLFWAVSRSGKENVTNITNATAFLLIFIFITLWCKNVHSQIFEPIHQSPDGICFFNSQEFISSWAARSALLVPCLQVCHRLTVGCC